MISDKGIAGQGAQLAEAERRQRIVSEISRVFLEYSGPDEVEPLRRVVELVVAGLGDWCAFHLVDADGFVREAVSHHPDEHQREIAKRLAQIVPVRRWDEGPAQSNVFVLGRPFYVDHITDEMLRRGSPSDEAYQLYKEVGLSSIIVAPLRSGEQAIGMLTLASTGEGGRRYSEHDVEFITAIADRATLAVRNARLVKSIAEERDRAQGRAAELTAVFESNPNGLALYGPDGCLKYASPRMEQLLDFDFKSHIGKHWREIYDLFYILQNPDQRAQAMLRNGELFADHRATLVDEVTISRGEIPRVLRRTSVPVRNEAGQYLGRFFIFTDLTQERELDAQRAQFLTVASHELRTPLTPLAMHLQTIERKLEKGQPIELDRVVKARRQLARLTTLVDDLLDVSRFETGRLALSFERMKLDELVSEVLGDFRSAHAGHDLTLEKPDVPIIIEGDRKRLEQVLVNLLQNAVKYSPSGSRIALRLQPHGREVAVSVSDQGIGIPEEEQGRLFERFFRAHNARVTNYGGLGMGLFISHEIIQRHGGRFEVKSATSVGSTFTFHLPLAVPMAVGTTPPRPRILVVDDDPSILEATVSFLEEEGYLVDQASNGVAALEFVRRSSPDLILVDLMMPVLDGGAFIAALRREKLAPDARIVVLSADRAVSAKSHQLQVDAALGKPFDLDELDAIVSRLLKKSA